VQIFQPKLVLVSCRNLFSCLLLHVLLALLTLVPLIDDDDDVFGSMMVLNDDYDDV
jgi:hypothetical protein